MEQYAGLVYGKEGFFFTRPPKEIDPAEFGPCDVYAASVKSGEETCFACYRWEMEPPEEQGYYFAFPRDADCFNQEACEIVYLNHSGRWRVWILDSRECKKVEDFSLWMGPILLPVPPEKK